MNRSFRTRLKKLENGTGEIPKAVVIIVAKDEDADQKIADLRANGELQDNQQVIAIRRFTDPPGTASAPSSSISPSLSPTASPGRSGRGEKPGETPDH